MKGGICTRRDVAATVGTAEHRRDWTRFLLVLAGALDLVGRGVFPRLRHGMEVAYAALATADIVGMSDEDRRDLFWASILHDAGVSTSAQRLKLIEFEVARPFDHAERGARLLARLPGLPGVAGLVEHHHDRYDGDNPCGVRGDEIPLGSRMIHLADRATILAHHSAHVLHDKGEISARIRAMTPAMFDPSLVSAFERVAGRDSFWLDLLSEDLESHMFSVAPPLDAPMGPAEIEALSRIYAEVIDDKSPFTRKHSAGVAAVAGGLAEATGFPRERAAVVRLAGFLHDLGKLAVPEEILDKPGPLTPAEQAVMREHPYQSYRILRRLPVFPEIAAWGSYHHERLDGTGYPFGIEGDALDAGSRIVCVSDVFQALNQDRPYRPAMSRGEVARFMTGMAEADHLDAALVRTVLEGFESFKELARAPSGAGGLPGDR